MDHVNPPISKVTPLSIRPRYIDYANATDTQIVATTSFTIPYDCFINMRNQGTISGSSDGWIKVNGKFVSFTYGGTQTAMVLRKGDVVSFNSERLNYYILPLLSD